MSDGIDDRPLARGRDGLPETNAVDTPSGGDPPATAQEIQERLDRIRDAIYAAQHADPSADVGRFADVGRSADVEAFGAAPTTAAATQSVSVGGPSMPVGSSPDVVRSPPDFVGPASDPSASGFPSPTDASEASTSSSSAANALAPIPAKDTSSASERASIGGAGEVHGDRGSDGDAIQDDAHAVAAIDGILSSPQRFDAIETFAQTLLPHLPDANVAIAVGRSSILRIVDGRLGWLSTGNVIRRRCQSVWEKAEQEDGRSAESPATASFQERCRGVVGEDGYRFVSLGILANGHRIRLAIMPTTPGSDAQSAPIWVLKHRASILKAIESRPLHRWMTKQSFVGSKPLVTIAILLLVMIGFGLWPVPYPVRCQMVLRPEVNRRVAAPFEASLAEALVQPGEVVAAGDTLVRLDGRPLRLELESIRSEMAAASKDRLVAMASGQLGQAQAAELQVEKLRHRGQRLSDRLRRLDVQSPIDGVVIAEDLKPHVGTPLTTGQTLLEVASLNPLQAEIEVPAFEINMIGSGASIRLRTDAGGGPSEWTRLQTIEPAAEIRDDQQVFLTRVMMPNPDAALRPGMRGDAVIYGPMRPMAWSILRPWYERLLWYVGY